MEEERLLDPDISAEEKTEGHPKAKSGEVKKAKPPNWIQNMYENSPITVKQLDIFIITAAIAVLVLVILSVTGVI